jgi:TolB-like protein
MIYKVAGFIVDRGRFELSRDGEPIALQPRAMRLLLMLLEADGRLVTKAQIVAAIWDGRAISDSALTSQVKALRKALGDTLRPCRIVGTVHAEGLRILAPIETRRPAAELPARGGEAENIDAIGAQPSIAVLPLDVLPGDGPPPIVAEALPAEIIDALARMRWLKVIARVSSFGMRGPGDDLDHVRERLGADYCLSGLVETAGDRLKVGVELADTRDRSVVWTQRYEAGLEEVHALREEIVGSVVSNIEITVPQHEMKLTRLRDPDSLTAWELYHTGMGRLLSPSRLAVQPIEDAFRRAFAIDPDFARAHAGLSELCWRQLKEQIELRPERLALLLS